MKFLALTFLRTLIIQTHELIESLQFDLHALIAVNHSIIDTQILSTEDL